VEWWRSEDLQVGEITRQVQLVRIVNTLVDRTAIIEVGLTICKRIDRNNKKFN